MRQKVGSDGMSTYGGKTDHVVSAESRRQSWRLRLGGSEPLRWPEQRDGLASTPVVVVAHSVVEIVFIWVKPSLRFPYPEYIAYPRNRRRSSRVENE